jgi:hypothetical protein
VPADGADGTAAPGAGAAEQELRVIRRDAPALRRGLQRRVVLDEGPVEAPVSRVREEQLFYLMSRGMPEDEAMAMIVRGFIEPIARELPMEYALELNRLIELQMEGSVG